MEKAEEVFSSPDPWAAPTQQVFVVIGIVFVSYKIFCFWRMIASLFIIPGKSVSTKCLSSGYILTDTL